MNICEKHQTFEEIG